MRVSNYGLAMLFAVAQLSGTSVAGRQIVAVSPWSGCASEAQDSLQISWTQPCYEGDGPYLGSARSDKLPVRSATTSCAGSTFLSLAGKHFGVTGSA